MNSQKFPCDVFKQKVPGLIDGKISDPELRGRIRGHILVCEGCAGSFAEVVDEKLASGELEIPNWPRPIPEMPGELKDNFGTTPVSSSEYYLSSPRDDGRTHKLLKQHPAMRESTYYRDLLCSWPDAVFVHEHGTILYVNPVATQFLGAKDPSELTGKSLLSFIPQDSSRLLEFCFHYGEGQNTPNERVRGKLKRITGDAIDVEVMSVPVCYEGASAQQMVVHDISSWTEAVQHSSKEMRLFRQLVENADGMAAVYSTDGIVKYINPAGAQLLGRRRKEIIGQHYSMFTTPQSFILSEERLQRIEARDRNISRTYEKELIKPDGQIVIVEASTHSIYEGNKRVGSLGLYRDITRRRAVHAQLLKITDRFWTLFGGVPVGVALLSLDEGRYILTNPAFREMIKYSEDDLFKMTYRQITFSEDLAVSEAKHNQLKADFNNKGRCEYTEFPKRYINKYGDIVYTHVRVSPCEKLESEEKGFFSIIQQIPADVWEDERQRESKLNLEKSEHSDKLETFIS